MTGDVARLFVSFVTIVAKPVTAVTDIIFATPSAG
jgi:hypothetical protein